MDSKEIKQLFRSLRIRGATDSGKWINASCPFAPWTHANKKDSSPSFGVKVGSKSHYHCFSCHKSGSVRDLVLQLAKYRGEEPNLKLVNESDSIRKLSELLSPVSQEDEDITDDHPEPWDLAIWDCFEPCYSHPYFLEERGLSRDVCELLDVRLWPLDEINKTERLLIPIFDINNDFYGFTGRKTDDTSVAVKQKDQFVKRHFLLGEHFDYSDFDFVCLVEGPVDFAKVLDYGYAALGSFKSRLTREQVEKLLYINKPVVFMRDDDQSGRDGQKIDIKHLQGKLPLFTIDYPVGVDMDPGKLTYNECKHALDNKRPLHWIKRFW